MGISQYFIYQVIKYMRSKLKFILDYFFQKNFNECFVSFAGTPLPMKLEDHSIVTIGGDIIVIGGRNLENMNHIGI